MMPIMDWWSIAFGFVSLGGLFVSQFAYRESKKANRIAKGALTEATEANRIAIDANKLAKDANTISNRALRIASEDLEYQWGLRVKRNGAAYITHKGSHEACDLALFADVQRAGETIDACGGYYRETDRVSFGGEIFFNIKREFPQLISKVRAQEPHIIFADTDRPITSGKTPVEFKLVIKLNWRTPGGRECGRVLEYPLSCREDQGGNIVFTMDS